MSEQLITVGEATEILGVTSDLPANKCLTKDEFDNLVSQIPGGTYGYIKFNLLGVELYKPEYGKEYISLLLSDLKQNTYILIYCYTGEFEGNILDSIQVDYSLYITLTSLQDGQEKTYRNNTFRRVSDRIVLLSWNSYDLGNPTVLRVETYFT